ncbi:MAG: ribonuclease III [Acidobacteria bacterium]|nr:ribonuclease III [Acidobacteriota bacterium]
MTSEQDAPPLAQLERRLGYEFRDRGLFERAVTHRSWAHEQVGPGEEERARALHNEALEFLGDSVLGLVVAEHLFRGHHDLTEGDLSRMKHQLVSTQTLAEVSSRLGIGGFIRLGHGEEKTGGRNKQTLLADSFEALLGAIYLDGGFKAATDFVLRALEDQLGEATPESAAAADYKTMLQERVQAACRVTPTYELISTEGPPHDRTFHVEVRWNEMTVKGTGTTIKAAEMESARRALEHLEAEAAGEAP